MRLLKMATPRPLLYTCSGCDRRRWSRVTPIFVDADTFPFHYYCEACAENGGKPVDPYADLDKVVAAETRLRVNPRTMPKPDLDDYDADLTLGAEGKIPELGGRLAAGSWHIDGDRRVE